MYIKAPPDILISDASKNFASKEFRQHAATMDSDIKEVPVEAHNSVGKVERYHGPLRRAYEILSNELPSLSTNKEVILQMAVKAVNDSAGPDGIVPTLLVFGAYPRMTKDSLHRLPLQNELKPLIKL
jgi:di/tripeptidase